MKHVQKQEAPVSFERWKAQANDDWQPTYADLQNPEKAQLQEALLSEQGWVCCYCGRSIEQAHSHIEHFRPQEHYPDRVLSYDNLHASCIRETSPGTPLHCGHAKGNAFDEALAISPTTPGCEQQFRYTLDGQIIPKNDNAAYMCNLLKLDIEFLNDRRAAVLQGVFDNDFLENASTDELNRLREGYKRPDADGHLPDFGHIVARYAEQLMGEADA
ncbi:retron system putative HNH endonuclease [Xanthomonas massiliensis]|uniref:retron system putative HNH endonuclease n=1 Tax=Xanthomonas massiliensis TaxID=1720302 RepID=UPI00082458B0|nr:retron system putative HNH endonuclease [Xanthomonas massiliensis]